MVTVDAACMVTGLQVKFTLPPDPLHLLVLLLVDLLLFRLPLVDLAGDVRDLDAVGAG